MRLSQCVRGRLAGRTPGFALIPSLTCRKRWPPAVDAISNIRSFNFFGGGTAVASMRRWSSRASRKRALSFVSTIVAMAAGVAAAEAGGFAVREQSAYGQGSSFAGMAAPGDSISSMFWNPAAVTTVTSTTVEGNLTAIFPRSELDVDPTRSTLTALGITGNGGNVGETGIVPAAYFATPITDQLYFGVSVNAPYGLSDDFGPAVGRDVQPSRRGGGLGQCDPGVRLQVQRHDQRRRRDAGRVFRCRH